MPTMNLTVQEIYPRGTNPKAPVRIMMSDGKVYKAWSGGKAATAHMFVQGQTYEVTFHENPSTNPQYPPDYMVDSVKQLTNGNGLGTAPGKPPKAYVRPDTSNSEHENMLVRGGVCAAISSGKINPKDPSEIEEVITALKEGLRRTINPQYAEDMNDSIPH